MGTVKQTARYWNDPAVWEVEHKLHWTDLHAVSRRLNIKVSGQPDVNWVAYTVQSFIADRLPLARCLSLGCGRGHLERELAALGVFEACDAFDVADEAIADARKTANAQGYHHINYQVKDIEHLALSSSSYDVVWIKDAMHHFARLEHVCDQICKSLRPNGLLVLNEYVGPSRFQFPSRQQEIIQRVLDFLPLSYRHLSPRGIEIELSRSPKRKGIMWLLRRLNDKIRDRDLIASLIRRWQIYRTVSKKTEMFKTVSSLPTVRDVVAADPSEAIRSQDILDVVGRHFEVLEIKELGGGLLQFLLAGIAHNFNEGDTRTMKMLDLLFRIEDQLMDEGDLYSDFAYIVARPRRDTHQC